MTTEVDGGHSAHLNPSTVERTAGRREATGAAHAKAILFGEHAVVYGAPAVAIPLHALTAVATLRRRSGGTHIHSALFHGDADDAPARIQPLLEALYSALRHTGHRGHDVDLRLDSTIPYERGLGSSAAVAVAVARATAALECHDLDAEEVHAVAMDAEKIAHGKSSGLDPRTVASEVPIRFLAGQVQPVDVGTRLDFVLADTGRPGATGLAVNSVREHLADEPDVVTPLIDRLWQIAETSMDQLADGDRDGLGAHMCEAHRHLAELGVSDVSLERLVDAAQRAGAYGSKLTGGGRGGCIIALARSDEHARSLEQALRTAGAARTWRTAVEAA